MKAILIASAMFLLVVPLSADADHQARYKSHDRPSTGVSAPLYRHASPPLHYQRHGERRSRHSAPRGRDQLAAWYARTAVAQSRKAWRYGCASSHPRWSSSYQEHYRWALRQHVSRVEREMERRERALVSCLAW